MLTGSPSAATNARRAQTSSAPLVVATMAAAAASVPAASVQGKRRRTSAARSASEASDGKRMVAPSDPTSHPERSEAGLGMARKVSGSLGEEKRTGCLSAT